MKQEDVQGCIGCGVILAVWGFNLSLIGVVIYVAYHFISKFW